MIKNSLLHRFRTAVFAVLLCMSAVCLSEIFCVHVISAQALATTSATLTAKSHEDHKEMFPTGLAAPGVEWKYTRDSYGNLTLRLEMFSPHLFTDFSEDEAKRVAESTKDVYITDDSGTARLSHTICKLDSWQEFPPWSTPKTMGYVRATKKIVIAPRNRMTSNIYRLQPRTCLNMFRGFGNLEKIEVGLGTGQVAVSLGADGYTGLHEKALGVLLDLSEVTSTKAMFKGCKSLKSLDLDGWDTSKIKDMSEMFSGCRSLTSLDLSGWNNSSDSVTLDNMFKGLWSLTSLRIERSNLQLSPETRFDEIGKYAGDIWQRVDAAKGGNERDPKGEQFSAYGSKTSAGALRDFLNKPDVRAHILNGEQGYYVVPVCNKGCSGDCAWGFVPNGKDAKGKTTYTFYLRPMDGKRFGTLDTWDTVQDVPWSSHKYSNYYQNTTKVEIAADKQRRPVRAQTCERMFFGCWKLQTADLSGLDTSSVENMRNMFGSCSELTSITGIGGLQTGRVTSMWSMFGECHKLSSIDVEKWDTRNVKSMAALFYDCRALASLNLKNWKFSKLTNMSFMFKGCTALTTLDASEWKLPKVTDVSSMFEGCAALTFLTAKKWDVPEVTNMSSMFRGCTALVMLDAGEWNIPKATNMSHMFRECTALNSLDTSGWAFSKVTDASYMFCGCKALTKLADVNTWDLSHAKTMFRMFSGCESLSVLDISGWKINTKTETDLDLGYLFEKCHKLTSVGDLSGGNMRAVTNMEGMFLDCHSLESLKLGSKEKTDKLMSMSQFVKGCHSLTLLALTGSFSTENTESMANMFQGTFSLQSLSLGPHFKFIHKDSDSYGIHTSLAFGDAGADVGSHWKLVEAATQADLDKGVFESHAELIRSQNRVRDQGSVREYELQARTKGLAGDCSWEYVPNEEATSQSAFKQKDTKPTYTLRIRPYERRKGNGPFAELKRRGTLSLWASPVCKDISSSESYRDRTTKLEIIQQEERGISCFVTVSAGMEMFKGFSALKTIDFSGLFAKTPETSMGVLSEAIDGKSMLEGCFSIVSIRIGSGFNLMGGAIRQLFTKRDAAQQDITWMQVNLGEEGTKAVPKGALFTSADELNRFHLDRSKRKTDVEEYIRVSKKKLTVVFDGGATDATLPSGEEKMESQVIDAGTTQSLKANRYSRDNHRFSCWEGPDGTFYKDKADFKNERPRYDDLSDTITLRAVWVPLPQPHSAPRRSESDIRTLQPSVTGSSHVSGSTKADIFPSQTVGEQSENRHEENNARHQDGKKKSTKHKSRRELAGGKEGDIRQTPFYKRIGVQARSRYGLLDNVWYYYGADDGTELRGQHELFGSGNGGRNWFHFNEKIDADFRNFWKKFPSQNRRCYYGPDGAMLKGRLLRPNPRKSFLRWFGSLGPGFCSGYFSVVISNNDICILRIFFV